MLLQFKCGFAAFKGSNLDVESVEFLVEDGVGEFGVGEGALRAFEELMQVFLVWEIVGGLACYKRFYKFKRDSGSLYRHLRELEVVLGSAEFGCRMEYAYECGREYETECETGKIGDVHVCEVLSVECEVLFYFREVGLAVEFNGPDDAECGIVVTDQSAQAGDGLEVVVVLLKEKATGGDG